MSTDDPREPERCDSESPVPLGVRTLRCTLPAGHDTHINGANGWSTLTGPGLADAVLSHLSQLDGSAISVLSMVTGLSPEEIDELGGMGEQPATRASQSPERPVRPEGDAGDGHEPPSPTAALSAPTMAPEDAVKAVAEALLRAYDSEFCASHLSWKDFTGQARELIAAAMPAIRASVADEIDQLFGPFDENPADTLDDQDAAGIGVVRHLRGLCTICGRAPDAEPCGHAHAMTQRGEGR